MLTALSDDAQAVVVEVSKAISTIQNEATVVLVCQGRADHNASALIGDYAEPHLAACAPYLILDFAGVDYVSSAALRGVLVTLKKARLQNTAFAV